MAVDLNESFKAASCFLEKPCCFNCAAPGGGEGECFDAAISHAGNQVFHRFIADRVIDVEVFVSAVFGCFVVSPDSKFCFAKTLKAFCCLLVKGSCSILSCLIGSSLVSFLCFLNLLVGFFKNVLFHGVYLRFSCFLVCTYITLKAHNSKLILEYM